MLRGDQQSVGGDLLSRDQLVSDLLRGDLLGSNQPGGRPIHSTHSQHPSQQPVVPRVVMHWQGPMGMARLDQAASSKCAIC